MKKDLKLELVTKESMSAMLIFALLVMATFGLAFGGELPKGMAAAGLLWITFLFAHILGLNRAFFYEKEEGCMEGLLLAPIDRSCIYISKVLSNFIFLSLMEALVIPIFLIFFAGSALSLISWLMLATLVLANLGMSVIGVLLAAISMNTRARDLMLPLLFIPVIVPVLLAAIKSTEIITAGGEAGALFVWLRLLLFYDIIFALVAFLTFEYVVEE
ncbi:MAG: heme exporter protein CcmB [Actinomycetota bacterium]|nr:heme exporter protein CcmB [Actinomycetota bacterium]